ncbi:MAG: DUF2789 domain-containing protein [Gammaproteobacteria bacterium]|nr:DUF2789 domain-containing protein [Gammaproteobacteria bacterium]MBU1414674.1 DUF2789 domain-containing protein [Gammaproteobacteria bacterium]
MEQQRHDLAALFAQLGLPADAASVEAFITGHRPLAPDTSLAEAPFWTPAQAAFLAEELQADADWTAVIDELDVELRRSR